MALVETSKTQAQWTTQNPVLVAGELGKESDTNKFKIGNGVSTWSALKYISSSGATSLSSNAGRELKAARRQSQYSWSGQQWNEIEGLQFRLTTTDGPAYLTLNLGLCVVNGVETVGVGYRIINTDQQKAIIYSTVNILGNSVGYNSGYLPAISGRIPNGILDQRYVAQIQVLGNFGSAYIIPDWLPDAVGDLYSIGA